jgi:hypothetical protein
VRLAAPEPARLRATRIVQVEPVAS